MPEFSYSRDGETYHGTFATFEEAKAEALSVGAEFVGENRPPSPPENFFDAQSWIEDVSCQDDYSIDAADDWAPYDKELFDELNREVRAVMAAWLDRHGLRPTFWVVDNAVRVQHTAV